jgi:hypothetical protein
MKSYGVKPDELLAWQRLLPNQKQTFALISETTEFPFKEMLLMAQWRMMDIFNSEDGRPRQCRQEYEPFALLQYMLRKVEPESNARIVNLEVPECHSSQS